MSDDHLQDDPLHRALNLFETRDRRQWTLVRVLVFTLAVSVGVSGYQTVLVRQQGHDLQRLTESTNVLVADIARRSSPETVARQQAIIDGLVSSIRCEVAEVLQSAMDGLADQGLIERLTVPCIPGA